MKVLVGLILVTVGWWALLFPLTATVGDCFELYGADCSRADWAVVYGWFTVFGALILASLVAIVLTATRAVRRRRVA